MSYLLTAPNILAVTLTQVTSTPHLAAPYKHGEILTARIVRRSAGGCVCTAANHGPYGDP